jgi:hypothetical protein
MALLLLTRIEPTIMNAITNADSATLIPPKEESASHGKRYLKVIFERLRSREVDVVGRRHRQSSAVGGPIQLSQSFPPT